MSTSKAVESPVMSVAAGMGVDGVLFHLSLKDMEQKMKMLENLQDDFDFNYKTLKSAGGEPSQANFS